MVNFYLFIYFVHKEPCTHWRKLARVHINTETICDSGDIGYSFPIASIFKAWENEAYHSYNKATAEVEVMMFQLCGDQRIKMLRCFMIKTKV